MVTHRGHLTSHVNTQQHQVQKSLASKRGKTIDKFFKKRPWAGQPKTPDKSPAAATMPPAADDEEKPEELSTPLGQAKKPIPIAAPAALAPPAAAGHAEAFRPRVSHNAVPGAGTADINEDQPREPAVPEEVQERSEIAGAAPTPDKPAASGAEPPGNDKVVILL